MAPVPWRPFRLGNLDEQIDRAFDELIHGKWGLSPPSGEWQPEIDVYETDDAYLVEADVPGVALQDIHVDVAEHWLTISGSRRTDTIAQSAQGVWIERRKGSFLRRCYLQHAVDPRKVQRTHHEGTLHLVIFKRTRQPKK